MKNNLSLLACGAVATCVALLLALAPGCSLASPDTGSSANLFANGDMTKGDKVPDGWSVGWTGSGKVEAVRDTQVFKSAPSSLCVKSVGGPANGGAGHQIDASLKVFTISGCVKCGGALKDATVALQSFDAGWKQVGWTTLADYKQPTDWSSFKQHVQLPANAMATQLVVIINGDGEAWLDDVDLVGDTPQIAREAPALPIAIGPNAQGITYTGRFDARTDGKRCAWPASEVAIRFHSSAVNVRLDESGSSDEYEVIVDGTPTAELSPSANEHVYRLFTAASPESHEIEVVKRTETFFGNGKFEGFQLAKNGTLAKIAPHAHKIELVGDSISCGYGDEASSQNEHFSSTTEDAAFAYGAVASRALDADFTCIAWSGKLMWPTNTMPEIYDRTIGDEATSKWDFTKWIPDVVVINLSTNDFAKGIPDETGWTIGYEAFISRIRALYPKAAVYCAMSPMLFGKPYDTLGTYLAKIVADEKANGDTKVHVMPFKVQDISKGIGADWHPNLANQRILADTMATTISSDLGWKIVADPSANMPVKSILSLPQISLTANNGN